MPLRHAAGLLSFERANASAALPPQNVEALGRLWRSYATCKASSTCNNHSSLCGPRPVAPHRHPVGAKPRRQELTTDLDAVQWQTPSQLPLNASRVLATVAAARSRQQLSGGCRPDGSAGASGVSSLLGGCFDGQKWRRKLMDHMKLTASSRINERPTESPRRPL